MNQTHVLDEIHKEQRICCIAIDEAHCVSQWGHDFRDSYRLLRKLRDIGNIPILACTATATPDVRNDICNSLRMPKAHLLRVLIILCDFYSS